jgi:hypothetical protein
MTDTSAAAAWLPGSISVPCDGGTRPVVSLPPVPIIIDNMSRPVPKTRRAGIGLQEHLPMRVFALTVAAAWHRGLPALPTDGTVRSKRRIRYTRELPAR